MAAKKKSAKKRATKRSTKKATSKKAARKKAAAKKKAAKRSTAKKKAAKRGAKKAATKRAATKKAAVKKKAAKRSTKKAAAKKKASRAKSPSRKKAAAKRAIGETDAEGQELRDAGAIESAMPEAGQTPARRPATDGRPTAGGLRRGRRRRLPDRPARPSGAQESTTERKVLPLPDEAFELPSRRTERPTGSRPSHRASDRYSGGGRHRDRGRGGRAPTGRAARDLLEQVRRGDAEREALEALEERTLRGLARSDGLRPRRGESVESLIERLASAPPRPATPVARHGGREARGTSRRGGARASETRVEVTGLLEMHPDGYGFLRRAERSYSQHPEDVYVGAQLIRELALRPGHWIEGQAHRPRPGQAYLALESVAKVNGGDPARIADVTNFKELTVVYPDTRLPLETGNGDDIEMRVMDLFCPIGRGQRGLIVAPPRSGKTVLLTKLADAMAENSPEVKIVVLLVDERPEEVTNMRRSVKGEVIASTFDKPASNHVRVAELVIEKVKRMVEFGEHVVMLLDSITRLGRAYNNQTGGSGRILTGGLDANALTKPKRFFSSARNVEDGGSLTIVASALVDTGSKLDQVIFEEFKGTGNMECVLSRELSNARVWPAIDVPASGTRNEDLLLHPDEMERIVMLRRGVTGQDPQYVMEQLRRQLTAYGNNAEFLMALSEGGL